ncbi:unnamed protein product, partial [Effrenium voratum]
GEKGGHSLVALEGSAYPSEQCPDGCRRQEGVFQNILDCFRCPPPGKNQSALRELCEHFLVDRTHLAIIDTGGPGVEEWWVMETFCRPASVFLVNTVFPLHEGWIGQRLQSRGWREVLSGRVAWGVGFPGMLNLVEETRWSYLVDFSA